ncbi:hypothetical protein K438DRAFT_1789181 [Mycena galopus ATCC 62051]|nr:hypothetical protein K438DRAFT_1789181 [Mycena galopus ATCC 62051]
MRRQPGTEWSAVTSEGQGTDSADERVGYAVQRYDLRRRGGMITSQGWGIEMGATRAASVTVSQNEKYKLYNTDELIREAHRIIEKYQAQLTQAAPPNSKYHLDMLLGALWAHDMWLRQSDQATALHIAAGEDHGLSIVVAAKTWLDQFLAEREHYYCTITGLFDRERGELLDSLGHSNEVPQAPAHKMVAAHIIPLYLNSFDETWDDTANENTKCRLHMGHPPVLDTVPRRWTEGRQDHFTLATTTTALFPNEDNKYRAACLCGLLSSGAHSSVVIFNNLEPPNPDYFMIHAVFARGLHLCGAAEYMEDIRRDAERVDLLYSDG